MNERLVIVLLVASLVEQTLCRPKSNEYLLEMDHPDDEIIDTHVKKPNGNGCCVTIHRCCSKPRKHIKHHGLSAETSNATNDSEGAEKEAKNDDLFKESTLQENENQNNSSNLQSSIQTASSKQISQRRRNYNSCCGNLNHCCSRRKKHIKHCKQHGSPTKASNNHEGFEGTKGDENSNGIFDGSSSQENMTQNIYKSSEAVSSEGNVHTKRSYSACCRNRCCSRRNNHKKHREHHAPSVKSSNSSESESAYPNQNELGQDLQSVSSSQNNKSRNTNPDIQSSAESSHSRNSSKDTNNNQDSKSNLMSELTGNAKDLLDHKDQISSNNLTSSAFYQQMTRKS